MKGWLPVFSLIAGFSLGFLLFSRLSWQMPAEYAPYLSVAALAGLDTIFGGIRSGIEGRFQNDIFASGFILNTLLAAGLAWLGDRIGVNLALVAVIALGSRVFLNLSLIRRYYLNKLALARSKQQEEAAAAAALANAPVPMLNQKPEVNG
jgi:small basic protein